MMKARPLKIGVALGGGGARGLAHLGVLKVFEEEGIPVDCIAGSSIGAIVGAAYAQNPNPALLIQRFKETLNESFYDRLGMNHLKAGCTRNRSFIQQATQNIKRRIVLNLAQSRDSLLKEFPLQNILTKFIEDGKIEDTEIPLAIIATSLHTGENTAFRRGDVIPAVAASASIPGILCPVGFQDDLLTDGGVGCPVPLEYLPAMGADITIGVEISTREYPPMEAVNVVDIIARADMITSHNLSRIMVKMADVAICPDTGDLHWSDFSKVDELVEEGVKAARKKLSDIMQVIRKRSPWYRRPFLNRRSTTPEGRAVRKVSELSPEYNPFPADSHA
jgi:NTE family protein